MYLDDEGHDEKNSDIDQDAFLWRYMDFPKFLSLLKEQALYFTRVGALQDKFEGHFSQADYEFLQDAYLHSNYPHGIDIYGGIKDEVDRIQDEYYVTCWREGEDESLGMWEVYTEGKYGIAIQTDLPALLRDVRDPTLLNGSGEVIDSDVVKIQYSSSEEIALALQQKPFPLIYKRIEFDYEVEVRGCIQLDIRPKHGQLVEVDLKRLIQSVVVSPGADQWFVDLVADTMKQYGVYGQPQFSALDREPQT